MDRAYFTSCKPKHSGFYILLSLMLLLCFFKNLLQINIPQVLMVALGIAIMIVGNHDEIIAMCICCIPLHTMFQYIYIILFGVVCYVVKQGKKINLNLSIMPIMLIVLWELIHCFGNDFAITQFIGTFLPFLLLAILMCSNEINLDYEFIVRAFVITIVAACAMVLARQIYVSRFNMASLLMNLQRFGMETPEIQSRLQISEGRINPNTLGIICVLGITGLLQVNSLGRGRKSDIALILILLLFGLLTASRTYLVCLAIMAVLFLAGKKERLSKKIKIIGYSALIILFAIFLLWMIVPKQLEFFLSRLSEKDISGGRFDLMKIYNDFISSANVLLYGIGLHDFVIKVIDEYRVASVVPHNGMQEIILAWGGLGIFLFIWLLWSMWSSANRTQHKPILQNYIPFLIFLAKVQAGQFITSAYTLLTINYVYLSMRTDLVGNDEVKTNNYWHTDSVARKFSEVDLWRFAKFAWKKRRLLFAVVMCGSIISGVVTKVFMTPTFESSILLYTNNSKIQVDQILDTITDDDIRASRSQINTNIEILLSRETISRIMEYAEMDITYENAREMISAYPGENSQMLRVVVESLDPTVAEKMANAIAAVLPVRIDEIIGQTSTKVVDYAVIASKPSAPSLRSNVMIGFMASFVVGVACLLLIALRDNKVYEEADITNQFKYPILGIIPELDRKKVSLNRWIHRVSRR